MILVTGGFGSIGAHTALALADQGEHVVVTRHRKAAPPSFLEGRVAVEQADLADLDAVRAIGDRHRITGIVHLAAVALEEPDAIAFMRRNTAMLLNALEVARTWRVRRFAVASSIGVYIGTPGPRLHEDLALVPATPPNSILAFKKSVEAITPQVLQGTGVEPVMPAHRHDLGPPRPSRLAVLPDPAAHLGHRARRGSRPDSAAACGLRRRRRRPLLRQGLRAGDRPAHACRHAPARHVQHLLGTAGRQPRVRHRRQRRGPRRRGVAAPGRNPDAPADDPYLDIARLTRDTGFEPAFDVRAGVADYVAWLREHPS